jgi:vacuolar protein sorting-associated protein 13A/C
LSFEASSPARERLKFALNAIRSEVHEKNRKWSWEYFAERRDDRKAYVKLFMKSKTASGGLAGSVRARCASHPSRNLEADFSFTRFQDLEDFDQLERKLTYEDIRFYRSIAKSELRKDAAMRRKLEEEKKASAPAQAVGWIGWAFGSKKHEESTDQPNDESMTDADRKGLLSLVGYDPDAADLQPSPDAPKDALKMRVTAKLKTGSFALRQDPHGKALDIVAVVWDAFQADVVQLTGSFDATVTLGGFRVYDGTTQGSVYPQIVRVKEELSRVEKRSNSLPEEGEIVAEEIEMETDVENPFLSVRFENNPLDGRADNAATVKMRHLEIIYHKGYVENVVKFFRPPESQLESISALMVCLLAHPASSFFAVLIDNVDCCFIGRCERDFGWDQEGDEGWTRVRFAGSSALHLEPSLQHLCSLLRSLLL